MAWYGCTEIFTRTGRETPTPGWWTINFYPLQTSKAKISVNTQPQKCACGLGRAEPVLSLPNNKAVLLWVVSWWGFCGEEVFLVVKAGSRGSADLAPIPGSRQIRGALTAANARSRRSHCCPLLTSPCSGTNCSSEEQRRGLFPTWQRFLTLQGYCGARVIDAWKTGRALWMTICLEGIGRRACASADTWEGDMHLTRTLYFPPRSRVSTQTCCIRYLCI